MPATIILLIIHFDDVALLAISLLYYIDLPMHSFLTASAMPLSCTYQLGLLDLDGVVYRGGQAVDHAVCSINKAQTNGMAIEYTTNNSSRFQNVVADQLESFGLRVEPWQVITSSVVAARMVARHVPQGSRVLVLGAEHLREEVRRVGLIPVDSCEDDPQAVIQGWYPQMTWNQMAQVAFAVEHGAQYYVTNRDLTIPREHGIAPGCGSMIQAVINATGQEPLASAGKPESAMYDEARMLVANNSNFNDSSVSEQVSVRSSLAIGDRLDTDIEAGIRGGYDSLLVLTGVTDPRMLMLAPQSLRPTYISPDLRGLNTAHEQPHVVEETMVVCGHAQASLDNMTISVSDPSHPDALRAACALTWKLMDEGKDLHQYTLPCFDVQRFFQDDRA